MIDHFPTIVQAKDEAKRLQAEMSAQGDPVGHAKSLELIAHRYGKRDWNTLSAAIEAHKPQQWFAGGRVSGAYLGHAFTATIVAVKMLENEWYRMELQLDEAVDVVDASSFSNFRKRVRGTIGPKGHTAERTSNGKPHIQLDLS